MKLCPDLFDDIHTHGRTGRRVLTNISPDDDIRGVHGEVWYSVGIHPWRTATGIDEELWRRLEQYAADARVAAIGEAGLDALRGGGSSLQEETFLRQVRLSEKVGKPLIVHCVRRYGRLMELRRELCPSQQWIIHGFTGKPGLVRQLLAAGVDISFGERFNPESVAEVPMSRRFYETDISVLPIDVIRGRVNKGKNI